MVRTASLIVSRFYRQKERKEDKNGELGGSVAAATSTKK